MTKTLTALLLVAGVLSGCTLAPRYERPAAPVAGRYERFVPVKMPYGLFVPAPPPWAPLLARPQVQEMEAFRNRYIHGWGWMGFDLGCDFRNALWPSLVAHLDQIYLVCPGEPSEKPLRELLTLLSELSGETATVLLRPTGTGYGWLDRMVNAGSPVRVGVYGAPAKASRAPHPAGSESAKEAGRWPIFAKVGIHKRRPAGPRGPRKK